MTEKTKARTEILKSLPIDKRLEIESLLSSNEDIISEYEIAILNKRRLKKTRGEEKSKDLTWEQLEDVPELSGEDRSTLNNFLKAKLDDLDTLPTGRMVTELIQAIVQYEPLRIRLKQISEGGSLRMRFVQAPMPDDEAPMRRLLQFALEELEDEGVEILVAEDGQEALEMIAEEQPDLILLDVMMPRMNGFDVCTNVRSELGMNDVVIILLTAKGQEADRMKGEEVGANYYITKPFDPDKLRKTAAEILGL